jgi:hypothetical protein
MKNFQREEIITDIEQFYCERLSYLVDSNRIEDSDSLYSEFVIDEKEPEDWIFMESIIDVF